MRQIIWTPEKLMKLRKGFGVVPIEALAETLGLEPKVVKRKASNLGLRVKQLRGPYNIKTKHTPPAATTQPRFKREKELPPPPIVRPPAVYSNKSVEDIINQYLRQ